MKKAVGTAVAAAVAAPILLPMLAIGAGVTAAIWWWKKCWSPAAGRANAPPLCPARAVSCGGNRHRLSRQCLRSEPVTASVLRLANRRTTPPDVAPGGTVPDTTPPERNRAWPSN